MKPISPEYPFDPNYAYIKGSKIHFVDEGKGQPILFLHGNPTSSYLWRNIIPYMVPHGRVIAPDLIGMGKSGKPNIDYTFFDHYEYLKTFIEQLNLKNILLVIHDWGSALGFHYANEHPDKVRGIAFMEAIFRPATWSAFPKQMRLGFKLFRTPVIGWAMISVGNVFIKQLLPQAIIRKLSEEEMANYEAPYPSIKSRKPIRVFPTQIPVEGNPENVHNAVQNYHEWLRATDIPKLCIYVKPGAIMSTKNAEWIGENFPNTEIVFIGKGLHFIQEDHPHEIGEAIADWYVEKFE